LKIDHPLLLSVLVATTAGICGAAGKSAGSGFDTWARSAFLGEPLAQAPTPLGLEGRRQVQGEFQKNQSGMKTPLPLGDKHYAHEQFSYSWTELTQAKWQTPRVIGKGEKLVFKDVRV